MIPHDLTELDQWVTWRYERDSKSPDKPKKVLKNPRTGYNASSTNPDTWTSYEEARAAAQKRGHAGVGFVFSEHDPFVGIDLDDCVEGEMLASWASEIVRALDSYTEISPSGKGVKIWVRGCLPENVKTPGIELYHRARYFTVTGQLWPGASGGIREANGALTSLYKRLRPEETAPTITVTPPSRNRHALRWADEKVAWAVEELRQAPEGTLHNRRIELGRLLGGVVALGLLTEEDAEQALLQAHPPQSHTGQEIKAIRDGIAYGKDSPLVLPMFPTEQTLIIRDGVARCPSCTTPVLESRYAYPGTDQPGWYCPQCKHPMVWPREAWTKPGKATLALVRAWGGTTLAELQHQEFPPEVWIISDLLPPGACLLAAKPKARKSWLALHAGLCVSTGQPFLGRFPVAQGRVLYLDLEGTQRRIKKRTRAMLGVNLVDWPSNFHIFTEWPQGDDGLRELELWFRDYPDTKLVVTDVMASFRRPMEPKEPYYQYDRETVKPINDLVERHDCANILVHHLNKTKVEDVFESISGSTGLLSVTNTQWVLGRSPEDRSLQIFLMQGRDLEHDEPLALRWDEYAARHALEGKAAEVIVKVEYKAILRVLADDTPRTPKEIADELAGGTTVAAVKQRLRKMLDEALVDKAGYGQYAIVRGSTYSENLTYSGTSTYSTYSSEDKSMQSMQEYVRPNTLDSASERPKEAKNNESMQSMQDLMGMPAAQWQTLQDLYTAGDTDKIQRIAALYCADPAAVLTRLAEEQ